MGNTLVKIINYVFSWRGKNLISEPSVSMRVEQNVYIFFFFNSSSMITSTGSAEEETGRYVIP